MKPNDSNAVLVISRVKSIPIAGAPDAPATDGNITRHGWLGAPTAAGRAFAGNEDDGMNSLPPPGGIRLRKWAEMSEAPALGYTPHSGPMQMAFQDGAAFPAFVAMRGSWNRRPPSGYEVMRVDSLGLDPGASREEVLQAIEGKVLAAGEIVGTFER